MRSEHSRSFQISYAESLWLHSVVKLTSHTRSQVRSACPKDLPGPNWSGNLQPTLLISTKQSTQGAVPHRSWTAQRWRRWRALRYFPAMSRGDENQASVANRAHRLEGGKIRSPEVLVRSRWSRLGSRRKIEGDCFGGDLDDDSGRYCAMGRSPRRPHRVPVASWRWPVRARCVIGPSNRGLGVGSRTRRGVKAGFAQPEPSHLRGRMAMSRMTVRRAALQPGRVQDQAITRCGADRRVCIALAPMTRLCGPYAERTATLLSVVRRCLCVHLARRAHDLPHPPVL